MLAAFPATCTLKIITLACRLIKTLFWPVWVPLLESEREFTNRLDVGELLRSPYTADTVHIISEKIPVGLLAYWVRNSNKMIQRQCTYLPH